MRKHTKRVLATSLVALAWAGCVAAGLGFMANYERTPGRSGNVSVAWPAASKIKRAQDQPTLLLFAHPRCPCTRATMGELAQVTAQTQGKLKTYVIFFEPPSAGADWTDTDLRQTAAAIPGVSVMPDVDGVETKRFQAETSGHALLFAADGSLLFSGGITSSRGHAGDNVGESAIVSLVKGHGATQSRTQIFGCAIAARDEIAQNSSK